MGFNRSHRSSTRFIHLDAHSCHACWKCVDVCHKHVLSKVDILGHRHARISNGDDCAGCLRCVKACEFGGITEIARIRESTAEEPAERRGFNKRAFVSLVMFVAASILPLSGILNHQLGFSGFSQERHFWMSVHNSAAALSTIFATIHIFLNRKALLRHATALKAVLISKEAMAALGIVGLIVGLFASHALHVR
jgi:ferredoxin